MVLQECFITQLQHISEVKCREWVIYRLPGCLTQDCAQEEYCNGWPYKGSMLPAFSWKEIQKNHTPEPSNTPLHTHTAHSMDKHTCVALHAGIGSQGYSVTVPGDRHCVKGQSALRLKLSPYTC